MVLKDFPKVDNKRALTVSEAAVYACVSRGTMNNWIEKDLIPYEKLPSKGSGIHRFILIRKYDIDTFLDKFYITNSNPKYQHNDMLILKPR